MPPASARRAEDASAMCSQSRGHGSVGDPAVEGNPERRHAGLGSQLSIEVCNAAFADRPFFAVMP
jgi:hypothetical protein